MTFSFKYTNQSYYCGSNPTSHYESVSLRQWQLKKNKKKILAYLKHVNIHLSGKTRLPWKHDSQYLNINAREDTDFNRDQIYILFRTQVIPKFYIQLQEWNVQVVQTQGINITSQSQTATVLFTLETKQRHAEVKTTSKGCNGCNSWRLWRYKMRTDPNQRETQTSSNTHTHNCLFSWRHIQVGWHN